MTVEIRINNSANPAARYVTWAPSPCRIRVTDPTGILPFQNTVQVELSQAALAGGGAIRFATNPTSAGATTLTLNVPRNGTTVQFFVRGRFGSPSTADPGVRINARWRPTPLSAFQNVGSVSLMVRVRKNAITLNAAERTRFLAAFAQLNNQGMGRFADFAAMHVNGALAEGHGRPGFLGWHRSYLLDLERELQAIDGSVALPYWRFDQPASQLFTADYMGADTGTGMATFSATNPLRFWVVDGDPGIERGLDFNPANAPPGLRTQAQTLALGTTFANFRTMEGNPHGSAHVSFSGYIEDAATAARDPLFFLLHCNVDRLWAVWQRANGRFNPTAAGSFDTTNPGNKTGHNLNDTLWPWNGVTGGDRPSFAPGGAMATAAAVSSPPAPPRLRDNFDYQGNIVLGNNMGFCYDDVAF